MNSIVVLTICAMFITFSEANIKRGRHPRNSPNRPLFEYIDNACTLMGLANYSVRGMGLDSPQISGCVYTYHSLTGEDVNTSFTLWFGNSYQNRPQCSHDDASKDDYSGVTQITFSCKELSSLIENTEDDAKYLRLIGQDTNNINSIRCALFEKDRIGSKMFRLAISGDHFCGNLSKILSLTFPKIPKDPSCCC